jgi:hypothetical protein
MIKQTFKERGARSKERGVKNCSLLTAYCSLLMGKEVCLHRTTGLPSGICKLATNNSSECREKVGQGFSLASSQADAKRRRSGATSTKVYPTFSLLATKFMEENICVKYC